MLAAALVLAIPVGATPADGRAPELGILRQLRFSPDGKYILAQDDTTVSVLATDPLRLLFQVPADREVDAQFTANSQELILVSSLTQVDSKQIRIGTGAPHIERWRIRDRVRVANSPIPSFICGTAVLSPDGRTFACDDLKATLHVVDVESGAETFIKKKFSKPSVDLPSGHIWRPASPGIAELVFSPEGRYLIAIPWDDGPALIWDNRDRAVVRFQGLAKSLLAHQGFTFGWADRLHITRPTLHQFECQVQTITFPSGALVSTWRGPICPFGSRDRRSFRNATDPNFVIFYYREVINPGVLSYGPRPRRVGFESRMRSAAIELGTGLIIPIDSAAADVLGKRWIEEVRPGEVALFEGARQLDHFAVTAK